MGAGGSAGEGRIQDPGTSILDPGSRIQDLGSCICGVDKGATKFEEVATQF